MNTLTQNMAVVNLLAPVDANGSSLSKSNATFFSMKGYEKATIIVQAGAMTEATTSVKAYKAKNVARGSLSSTALAISTYWHNKSSVSTVALSRATASSSKVVVTSVNSATYVFELTAKQLGGSSFDCIGVAITGISAAALMSMTAILHGTRYERQPMVNAKAN